MSKRFFLMLAVLAGYGTAVLAEGHYNYYYGEKCRKSSVNPCKGATIHLCSVVYRLDTPEPPAAGSSDTAPSVADNLITLPENVEKRTTVHASEVIVLPPDVSEKDYKMMKDFESKNPRIVVVKSTKSLDKLQ